jgi:replicative DNA helicase
VADLEALKHRLPIEQLVVQLGVSLSVDASKYAKALCPWHDDKNPSLYISKIHQTVHCFNAACSAHRPMDHTKLVRMVKHLSEDEAIDLLYELAGETRPIDSLADYLRRVLTRAKQNVGMDVPASFFRTRGVSPEVLEEMSVGYVPNYAWLKEATADVPPDIAAKLELLQPHVFHNAIVYPQHDGMGRINGFRTRPFASDQPYYSTSTRFPLKPSRIYGLHLVRGTQIVLVEGPNDVLSLRSAGITTVAGLNGNRTKDVETYLTERGFSDIVFIADGEEAGRGAMLNAPPLVRVNQIPEHDVDPDEYVVKYGPVAMLNLIHGARFPFEMKLESRLHTIPDNVTGKIVLAKAIAQDVTEGLPQIVLAKVKDRLAVALGLKPDEVDQIFELVDYDTDTMEGKLVSHLALAGPLTDEVKGKVLPWMFANPERRAQFEQLLSGKSLSEHVTDRGLVTEGDVEQFMDIARRRRLKGTLRRLSSQVMNMAQPVDDMVSDVMTRVQDLSLQHIEIASATTLLRMIAAHTMERYTHQDELLGLSLGKRYPKTNAALLGLRPETYYVLAGNTGAGKSMLALDWAIDIAFRQRRPVLWINLEMSEVSMSSRIAAKLTGVTAKRILSGKLESTDDHMQIATGMFQYYGRPLYVVTSGAMTMSQLVGLIRKMKAANGIEVVFLDYLGLIRGNVAINDTYQRIGLISQDLKNLVVSDRQLRMPVVAIAQLHRQAIKTSAPMAEHIAESYKVAQDASVVLTLKKRSPEEQQADAGLNRDWGTTLLNVAKNRDGEEGVIGLMFNRDNLRLREVGAAEGGFE